MFICRLISQYVEMHVVVSYKNKISLNIHIAPKVSFDYAIVPCSGIQVQKWNIV